MLCVALGASRGLRWSLFGLASLSIFLTLTLDPADARGRRKRYVKKYHHAKTYKPRQARESYSPRYSAIVLDAKTGKALHESSPDGLRHPASLTKVMTLYLLFEQLEAGRIRLNTALPVSEEAASQAPTKLGLRPGQTLEVEDAIKGLVTKSANDAAVVIAEALGGSEEAFADTMTRKAHALGMHRTVYRNASGLPNPEQVTTARDQAILGMAIQERFPRYYRYFSTPAFVYRGHAMRNHNKLLGRVEGVDGIKTGYTRASGFNLTTSVRRDGRHIVAVVLGGRSGGERDARMRSLIESNIAMASNARGPTTRYAMASERSEPEPMRLVSSVPEGHVVALDSPVQAAPLPTVSPAPRGGPVTHRAPNAPPAPSSETTAAIPAGAAEPIKPIPVRTVAVKLVPPKAGPAPRHVQVASAAPVVAPPQPQSPRADVESQEQPQRGAPPRILGVLPAAVAAAGEAIMPSANASERPPIMRKGWIIQVGAFEDEAEARQRLDEAQRAMSTLGRADRYTERTQKGAKTYYRARFAGFDRDHAEAACRQLKRNEIVCMALRI